MAFFRRLSIRRKRGTYSLNDGSPARPHSLALSEGTNKIPSGLIQCHVSLLDDSVYTCVMSVSAVLLELDCNTTRVQRSRERIIIISNTLVVDEVLYAWIMCYS